MKVASQELDIINVYRSSDAITSVFLDEMLGLIDISKRTIIVGDFNLCYLDNRNHPVFLSLDKLKFTQLVTNASHIQGRLIDLVFTNEKNENMKVLQQAQYYTDHDLIKIYDE